MHCVHDTRCDEQEGDYNSGQLQRHSQQDKFGKTLKQVEQRIRWEEVQGKVLPTVPHL